MCSRLHRAMAQGWLPVPPQQPGQSSKRRMGQSPQLSPQRESHRSRRSKPFIAGFLHFFDAALKAAQTDHRIVRFYVLPIIKSLRCNHDSLIFALHIIFLQDNSIFLTCSCWLILRIEPFRSERLKRTPYRPTCRNTL